MRPKTAIWWPVSSTARSRSRPLASARAFDPPGFLRHRHVHHLQAFRGGDEEIAELQGARARITQRDARRDLRRERLVEVHDDERARRRDIGIASAEHDVARAREDAMG